VFGAHVPDACALCAARDDVDLRFHFPGVFPALGVPTSLQVLPASFRGLRSVEPLDQWLLTYFS